MKRFVLLLNCLLLIPVCIHAGELYRWVDKSGKAYYGDAPTADAEQIERMKLFDTQDGDDLPYETRLARQNFPVILYMASDCSEPCQKGRDLLSKRGIPFAEKILLTQKEIDDFKQQTGTNQVPTLAVGKAFLVGFLAEQWDSELDIAGYPKTAPYRAPKALPTAASQVAPSNPAAQ